MKRRAGITDQYVWSMAGPNDLVLRDSSMTSNTDGMNLGKADSGLGQRLYVEQDANENVTALVGPDGTVSEHFVYSPYGAVTVINADYSATTTDANGMAYLYQGGRIDLATGLYHFGSPGRDYSPVLGRWMEVDAIGYGDGMNDYQGFGGNPISRIDPLGMSDNPFMPSNRNLPDVHSPITNEGPGLDEQLCIFYDGLVDDIMSQIIGVVDGDISMDDDAVAALELALQQAQSWRDYYQDRANNPHPPEPPSNNKTSCPDLPTSVQPDILPNPIQYPPGVGSLSDPIIDPGDFINTADQPQLTVPTSPAPYVQTSPGVQLGSVSRIKNPQIFEHKRELHEGKKVDCEFFIACSDTPTFLQ